MTAAMVPPAGHLLGGLKGEEERLDARVGCVAEDLVTRVSELLIPARIAPTGKDSGLHLGVFAPGPATPGHHHPAFLLEVFLNPLEEDVHQALSALLLGNGLAATLNALTQLVGLVAADVQVADARRGLDGLVPEVEEEFVGAILERAELPVGIRDLAQVAPLGVPTNNPIS